MVSSVVLMSTHQVVDYRPMNFARWTYVPPTPPPLPSPSESVLPLLMAAASQAPSGDNCQPWRFRARGDRLDIFRRSDVDTSFFNVDQLASTIACGCAIENACIAATAAGFEARVELLPEGPDASWMASIVVEPAEVPPSPLFQAIWGRQTNRKPYRRQPVPRADLEELVQASQVGAQTSLRLVTERPALRELSELVFLADRIRTENQSLHEYFTSMVRFTQAEAASTLDGLPLPNLEAGKPGEVFLKLTRPWSVMNAMGRMGAGNAIAFVSRQGILNSAGAGLIVAGPRGTASALEGGRALANTWLTATRLGLRFQPMTAITLFWERWRRGGEQDFSSRHRKMLEGLWPRYHALLGKERSEDRTHIMLFRFGVGPDLSYGTYRKPVRDMMWSM